MPRKGRGQSGESGGAYSNRTDLAAPQSRPQSVRVPTGQPYGEAQASSESQSQMPLQQEAQVDPFQRVVQAAQQTPFQPIGLNAPTERPNEPITHGLATGPGGGPEALNSGTNLSDALARVAAQSGNATIQAMLDRTRAMGL